MSRRVVVEEPCEHGNMRVHRDFYCEHTRRNFHDDCNGPPSCSGGSRLVLDGIPNEWVEAGARAIADLANEQTGEQMVWQDWAPEALVALVAAVFGGTR